MAKKLDPKKKTKTIAEVEAAASIIHAVEKETTKKVNIRIPMSLYVELKDFKKTEGLDMTAVFIAGSKRFMREHRG